MVKNISLLLIFLSSILTFSCGIEEALKQEYLNEGIWRGVIKTQGQEIPFNFEVLREDSVTYDLNFINGSERFNLKGLAMQGDSVFINIRLFDALIKAKLVGNKLIGIYGKNYDESSQLPFEAVHNKTYRFPPSKNTSYKNFEGKWEVTFMNKEEKTKAVGVFKQDGEKVEGTFITSFGDYRFLEGVVKDSTIFLSTFDGANAFLFKADMINPDEMKGHFWSGAFEYQSWHAVRNEQADIVELTKESLMLKENLAFNFNLTDLNGKKVSLSDQKYKDKIKIIHLFGTWCPNSIDEVRFLSDWQKNNKDNDVVIIGLAFEQKDDFTYAKNRVNNMASRLNVKYDFVVAGTADRTSAAEKFPVLKSIEVFPTTLILDKNNKIRKIKSGFYSPASGVYYERSIKEFIDAIQELRMIKEEDLSHMVTNMQEQN